MNTINRLVYPVVALLSLAAAFAAHAESPTLDPGPGQVWASAKTRAQVQTELAQARSDGSLKVYSISYNHLKEAKTTRTREEVRAQTSVERRVNGNANEVGEDSGSFYRAQSPLARGASPVLARSGR